MEEQVTAPRACVLPAVGRRVHASLAPEALHCGEMTASYRDSNGISATKCHLLILVSLDAAKDGAASSRRM